VPVVDLDEEPPANPIVCSTRELVVYQNGYYEEARFVYRYIDTWFFRFDTVSGLTWVRSMRTCSRGGEVLSSAVIWELISDPDPEIVAKVLRDRQSREIADPVPLMSPVGPGVVNLGMWLAVADPGVQSVTASAAPGSWVTVQAEITETVYDMGNGDVVRCAGVGDPIPDSELDSVEQSPICGYTYPATNTGEPYTITITSTWSVTWTSSRGTSGTEEPIVLTTTVPYDVVEIQTVGGYGD
jgi:hypothetical protein